MKSPEFNKLHENHRNIEVNIDCDDNLLPVLGSSFHLSKVIMNLMTNAAESMPGSGTIGIRACNTYLEKPIKGYEKVIKRDYTVLTVVDTGAGISPDDRDKIFEPFYTKKEMGRSGTGLGMTVIWDTIKDHGGYIDIEKTGNRNDNFTLSAGNDREDKRQRFFEYY